MEEKFAVVNGTNTRYFVLGNGIPLVMVHPFLADATTWMGVNEFLAEKFTVCAPDLPGYGKSEAGNREISLAGYAQFVVDFVEELKLTSFTLCGISMGGAIATLAREKIDDKVKAYVLVEPLFAWHYSRLAERHKALSQALTLAGNVPLSPKFFDKIINSDRWMASILSFFNKEKAKSPEKMAQLLHRYRACDFDVFRKILESIMSLDLGKESFITSKPALLAMNPYDEILDAKATVDGYKTLYPNLEYSNFDLPHDPIKPVTKEFLDNLCLPILEKLYKISSESLSA